MADKKDDKKDEKPADGASAPKKSKTPLIVGAVLAMGLVAGFVAAKVAAPSHEKEERMPALEGPFVTKLSKTAIQVNLAGEGSKRYLVMSLNAEFFAYDEHYVSNRLGIGGGDGHGEAPKEDPLYTAMLKDALIKLSARKTRDQVTDPVQFDAFLEDIRCAVDPLLFPVTVGDSHGQTIADSKSGLRVGESNAESNLRELLYDNELDVDARKRTIRFDDGGEVKFEGDERDLRLANHAGKFVFVDVSQLKPDFHGKVPIGVPGKLRKIYRDDFLVQ
jgi:flagellar basal body-associated protein FliL